MSTNAIQFFVPLRNEGTNVVRPATGVFVGPDAIRVDTPDDYDPDDEEWEFPPGSVVRCVVELCHGNVILVARSFANMSAPAA